MRSKLLVYIVVLLAYGCNQPTAEREITPSDYHEAVNAANQAIVYDVFSPPVASRVYAYPAIAAHEIAINNDPSYLSLTGQMVHGIEISKVNNLDSTQIKLAAILAYLHTAKELVFTDRFIEEEIAEIKSNYSENYFNDALEYAKTVTSQIMTWAGGDNYAETRTSQKYDIKKANISEGEWVPTPPNYMEPIEPNWNDIRPFFLDSASQFVPVPPPAYDLTEGSKFQSDLRQLYDSTVNLSKEEILIAEFWDCNPFVMTSKGHNMSSYKKITPGGHWVGIAGIAAETKNADFVETVAIYAVTTAAIADGFISCWDEKYRSNLIRPETVINFNIDPDWRPALQTPPFPEYTSGHSVVSGAASAVLTNFVGENFFFVDTTETIYGLPTRSFRSFYDASSEAAISRFYGGIHYMPAIENGLTQGLEIGKFINGKVKLKSND